MKICFLCDSFYPYLGGSETYLKELGIGLSKYKDIEEIIYLTALLPRTNKVVEKNVFDSKKIKIIRIPFPTSSFSVFLSRCLFSLGNVLLKKIVEDVDIYHVITYLPSFTGWIFRYMTGKPVVLFCHEFFREKWKFLRVPPGSCFFFKKMEEIISHFPYTWFICPSQYTKNSLVEAGVPPHKISVIYHGVSEIFSPIGGNLRKVFNLKDSPIVGWIGRMQEWGQKGIPFLLKTIKYVKNQIPTVKFLIGGPYFNRIKPLIDKLGVRKNVIYVGRVPYHKLPFFYRTCDVFLSTSISEGFGFTCAEAQKCGIPVVGFRTGALPEIVKNYKTGLLIEPFDVKELSESICEILQNREWREKMRKNCVRIFSRKFKWETSIKHHYTIYTKLLHECERI